LHFLGEVVSDNNKSQLKSIAKLKKDLSLGPSPITMLLAISWQNYVLPLLFCERNYLSFTIKASKGINLVFFFYLTPVSQLKMVLARWILKLA